MTPLPDGWSDLLEEIDKKHHAAHDRLRLDYRDLERKVENNYQHFDTVTALHRSKLSTLEVTTDKPVDATKLVLTLPVVLTILAAALTVAGTVYGTSTSTNAKIADLIVKVEAIEKLQDERASRLTKDVADLKGQVTMQDLKLTNLRETVLKATR